MLKRDWESSVPEHYHHQHRHVFTKGESETEREQWLQVQLQKAEETNTEIYCRRTDDGYEFGFKEFTHYAAFRLNAYGDPASKRVHKCTQYFPDGSAPHWIKAARAYLDACGINYDLAVAGDQVQISFDRFSEMAALRLMIDNGEIDHIADVLLRAELFLGRVSPGQDQGFSVQP